MAVGGPFVTARDHQLGLPMPLYYNKFRLTKHIATTGSICSSTRSTPRIVDKYYMGLHP